MSAQTIWLDAEYFPGIPWFQAYLSADKVILDVHEHFVRTSLRNRCYICGPNGILSLHVPLLGGRNQKASMKDIRIAYAEDWVTDHWRTLEACYRRTPYFEHFETDICRILDSRPEYLIDLHEAILEFVCQALNLPRRAVQSEAYEARTTDPQDWRDRFTARQRSGPFPITPYLQPFADRFGFVPDLSILDLLFCCGPTASTALQGAKK